MDRSTPYSLNNITMPMCTIIPVLVYPDLAGAITWLTRVFGFTERWRVGAHRAQLSFGDGTIAISEPITKTEIAKAQSPGARSAFHSMLVRVSDVQEHYEHSSKMGARIIKTPADFPYGERQYTVEDIGGHFWTFSQSIADVAPEDWGGTMVMKTH